MNTLGDADFVAEFCSPLPGRVIAEILGIDAALHREFKRWIGHLMLISPMYPGDELAAAIRTTVSELEGYLKEVVAARRQAPNDDMVSDLIRAEVDGQRLTDEEIIAFLFVLLPGGFETTMNLLATMMIGFTQRPDELTRLRADQSLIPAYVEESLRKEPPVHGITRLTLAEADIGGVKVPPAPWSSCSSVRRTMTSHSLLSPKASTRRAAARVASPSVTAPTSVSAHRWRGSRRA